MNSLQLVYIITTQSIKNGVNQFHVRYVQNNGFVIAMHLRDKI